METGGSGAFPACSLVRMDAGGAQGTVEPSQRGHGRGGPPGSCGEVAAFAVEAVARCDPVFP